MREVLTFILAGGRGERLNPLTRDRAKPAVPFGGIYRIIDFTLSNCVNSGLRRIYVLTQYKSFSLQKHLLSGWDIVSNQLGEFIDVIPAQKRTGDEWYQGTADAIYQNIYAIRDIDPELILILAGDHVYKMDYRKMIAYHKQKGADVTVACVRMPKETSKDFGVIQVDEHDHVQGFQEKPDVPETIPGKPDKIFASMGIYLFNKNVLIDEVERDAQDSSSSHDFGKNIIPHMLRHGKHIYVYNFVDKKGKSNYWRDIGTRDAYYEANMDLLGEHAEFNLYDKSWPLRTFHEQYPPIQILSTESHGPASIINSMISGGCIIQGGSVTHSVISPNVRIYKDAHISNSVIMEGVIIGEGAKVQNAIIDKQVEVPPHSQIGFDLNIDQERFVLTRQGRVIVPKKTEVVRHRG